jgi:predicted RNA methylase
MSAVDPSIEREVNSLSFEERFRKTASFTFGHHAITLEQTDGEQTASESMQGTVWNGGLVLAKAMVEGVLQESWVDLNRVIELGSGTGLCGIVAAKLGAPEVVMTDYGCLLPLLERNAAANMVSSAVTAVKLDFCQPGSEDDPRLAPPPDVIIGSDITAFVQQNSLLATTMARIAAPHTRLYLSHQDRGDIDFVLDELEQRFTCERVTLPFDASLANGKQVVVWALRPRPKLAGASCTCSDRGDKHHAHQQDVEHDYEGQLSAEELDAACRGGDAALVNLRKRFL